LYMTKSLSNKLYLKKQLYGRHMNKGITILEHLNFFNKLIGELLVVDIKINEEDKANFSVRFHSHMITLSPPCCTVSKLSF